MAGGAAARKNLAALIVHAGGASEGGAPPAGVAGALAGNGKAGGEGLLGSADPAGDGAATAADENGLATKDGGSDPFVELATEAIAALEAKDAAALADIFRAVRGMPLGDGEG